jgi:hypothetical protein
MTPDNNKVHFLTNVTSLLIPQRMNSFDKEEKVNFVKWYYSGLSLRDIQATLSVFYPKRPVPSLIWQISFIIIFGCQFGNCFPAITILTHFLFLFSLLYTSGRC